MDCQAHERYVLIAYEQAIPLTTDADVSRGARSLNLGPASTSLCVCEQQII